MRKYGVPDEENPEWTEDQVRMARPASEVLSSEFVTAAQAERRRRGKQKAPTKELISVRVDRDVLTAFRATGKGWQGRMNEALGMYITTRRIKRPRPSRTTVGPKPAKRRRAASK